MPAHELRFRHEVIDPSPPGSEHDIVLLADFDGDGLLDIFVGEMGLGRNPEPKLVIYGNQGGGRFEEVVTQHGIPTHEAKVADLNNDGRPDIVGKPYQPERHIDVWWNETDG